MSLAACGTRRQHSCFLGGFASDRPSATAPRVGLHRGLHSPSSVAKEILEKKQHIVALVTGHRFQVEAQPVQLVVPKRAEVGQPD